MRWFEVRWVSGDIGWYPGSVPLPSPEQGAAAILTPPLPAIWAEGLARRVQRHRPSTVTAAGKLVWRYLAPLADTGLAPRANAVAASRPVDAARPHPPRCHRPCSRASPHGWNSAELHRHTAGRRLLAHELYRRIARRGFEDGRRDLQAEMRSMLATLHRLSLEGRGRLVPAIAWEDGDTFRCARCQRSRMGSWPCSRCGLICFECETCASLGPVRSCDVVFEGPAPVSEVSTITVRPRGVPFALSPAQRDAARDVVHFLRNGKGEALLWAACGAGKTEVAFAGVEEALQKGGRVLFAVPRREVAAELGQRLREYAAPFDTEVAYGGAPPPAADTEARLVVATTHQCLRLGPSFDFVILDEVDAFPYRGSPFLRDALLGTLTPEGKLLTMTATPERNHLARARRGIIDLITIPARHHGQPLPIPRWVRERVSVEWAAAGPRALNALEACLRRGPTLVFVPTVAFAERLGRALRSRDLIRGEGHREADWVHSRRRSREASIAAFRGGETRLLVTTSLLERGVTIPSVQVVVWGADREDVWDERALVQMAGRAGRTVDDPDGLVFYISERRTPSMSRAVAQIRELNDLARRNGYLQPNGADKALRRPSWNRNGCSRGEAR